MADNFGLKIGLEGEKAFKQSIAEINSQFKVLGSEMKLVESEFAKEDNSIQAVTARKQVLTKEIEQQQKKIEVLTNALKNASESFGENDKRTQNWQTQLNLAKAELNKLEKELDENTKALDDTSDKMEDAGKNTDKFSDELEDANKTADKSGSAFSTLGSVVKGVGVAVAAAVAAIGAACVKAGKEIYEMVNDVAAVGDNIDKMSQRLGLSREAYQEWEYVLSQSGVEIDSVSAGMKKLINLVDDARYGNESALDSFEQLGISLEDLENLSQDDIFALVIKKLQEMDDETAKAAIANDIFGRSGQEMMPLLNNSTAEATEELIQKAHEYGMVLSDEAVEAAVEYTDTMDTLKRTFKGIKNQMAAELLPAFTLVLDGITDLIRGGDQAEEKLTKGITQLVGQVTKAIPKLVSLLSSVVSSIVKIAPEIIKALVNGIVDNLDLLIDTAAELVTSLVNAIGECLPKLIDAAIQMLETLVMGIIDNLPKIVAVAAQVISTLAKGIAKALPTLIPALVQTVVSMVKVLIDNLPLILDAALELVKGLAEGILNAIPVLIDALPSLILSIINFILGAIPQIINAGIQLLTSLVSALPTIIASIVEVIPQIIDGIISAIVEALPLIIEAGINLFMALIQALPEIIMMIVEAIPQIIGGIVNALVGNIDKLVMCGVQIFTAIIQNLPQIIAEIVSKIPQIISSIISAFGSLTGQMGEVGKNLVKGLWNGIQSLAGWIWDKVSSWASDLWSGIKSFFGIHSPSKKMAFIGEMMVEGMAKGIDDNDNAYKSAEELSKGVNEIVDGISSSPRVDIKTDIDEESTRFSLKRALANIGAEIKAVSGDVNYGVARDNGDSTTIEVNVPLYLDGELISTETSKIQSKNTVALKRALGVV